MHDIKRKLLIVTVGTSILEGNVITYNNGGNRFDPSNVNTNNFKYDKYANNVYPNNNLNPDHVQKFVEAAGSLDINEELQRRKEEDYDKYRAEPDRFPAEISSILLFLKEDGYCDYENSSINVKNKKLSYDIHLLISGTDRCKFCARAIQYYFNKKLGNGTFIPDDKLHIVKNLSEDSSTFNNGLKELLDKIDNINKNGYQERIINITAGYKGVIPYMVLSGMCYKNTRIIYLYETSRSIVEISKLPVNFDLAGWNDNRAFLRILNGTTGIYNTLDVLPIPEDFRNLFTIDVSNNYKVAYTPFGDFLKGKYESAKAEKALSEFGRGYILADLIQDPIKKDKLKKWINNSQNIWYGDNIPETVDHSRGHCQRLLELAAQIIRPIEAVKRTQQQDYRFLSDDELIVLTIVLWFHDIGHAGREMIRNFNDHLVIKLLQGEHVVPDIDISDFPTINRDLHHILGFVNALKDIESINSFGFYVNEAGKKEEWFLDHKYLTPAIYSYLYHRKSMPKNDGDKCFKYVFKDESNGDKNILGDIKINSPIPICWNRDGLKGKDDNGIRLRFLAALQAFIDECDNSRERVGDEEFKKRRTRQTEKEIKTEFERLKWLYPQLKHNGETDEIESLVQIFKNNEDGFYDDFKVMMDGNSRIDLKTKIKDKKVEDLLNTLIEKCFNGKIDLLFKETSMCLNKLIFKLIQNAHFDKSDAYSAVFFVPVKENNERIVFNIGIESENNIFDFANEYEIDKKTRNDYTIVHPGKHKNQAIKDICEQYNRVKNILENQKITFNEIVWYNEKDPEHNPEDSSNRSNITDIINSG